MRCDLELALVAGAIDETKYRREVERRNRRAAVVWVLVANAAAFSLALFVLGCVL